MDRERLALLIKRRGDVAGIIDRIKGINQCGGSGDGLTPALNRALDEVLELIGGAHIEPVAIKSLNGQKVRDALVNLEQAGRDVHRSNTVYWAGILVATAGEMARDHLINVSASLASEDAHRQ